LPPVIRLHDLRHTRGTQLYEAGYSIKVIAAYLGHDEVVLLRTYTHLRPDAQADMVRRFHESQAAGS